jgi:hypothetical protein
MDSQGNFVVIGMVPTERGLSWTGAVVAPDSPLPSFGEIVPYHVVRNLDDMSQQELEQVVLYTLPLPIPMNNYNMLFAPEQRPQANREKRFSLPLHEGYIADFRVSDGKRKIPPITLYRWLQAEGEFEVILSHDRKMARFEFSFKHLVPDSLYTVMSLREDDLNSESPSRPGPLGIPNVFITDKEGSAQFWAELQNPFPMAGKGSNRIINVVVLFMSSRQSYGGAIGFYGLGGDIHAHLKLQGRAFDEFVTYA